MADTDVRQRLAAILAADVAGYSRLMARDERATVAALDSARGIFREFIQAHQGRVIDMAGDSVLAVFDTATGAVVAALAIQEGLFAMAAGVPDDRRMRFRIGVHLGDVMEKSDGSIYGDGVNIAARLQALAEPGGITVSGAVRGAVRGKLTAGFIDLGEQKLKNIAETVGVFRIRSAGPEPAAAWRFTQKKALIVIIAVAALGMGAGAYYARQPLEEERTRTRPIPAEEKRIMLAQQQERVAAKAAAETSQVASAAPAPKQTEALAARKREETVAASAARSAASAPAAASSPSATPRITPGAAFEPDALYRQALAMESSGKAAESIRIYRRAARAGSGKAAKRLGEIYDRGVPGISRDYAESLQWYEAARQLGETVPAATAR